MTNVLTFYVVATATCPTKPWHSRMLAVFATNMGAATVNLNIIGDLDFVAVTGFIENWRRDVIVSQDDETFHI